MSKNKKSGDKLRIEKKEPIIPIINGDISGGFDLFCLGDSDTGWIPSTENFQDFANLLIEAEYSKPFIVYHYGIEVQDWRGVKVFLLGDRNSKWIPTPKNQNDFNDELKKHMSTGVAIIYHFAVSRLQY